MNDIAILIVLMESIRAREGGEQRDCPEFEDEHQFYFQVEFET